MSRSVYAQTMKQRWQWITMEEDEAEMLAKARKEDKGKERDKVESEEEEKEHVNQVCLLNLAPCAPDIPCRLNCRHNPGCLHMMGQGQWQDDNAAHVFLKQRGLLPASMPQAKPQQHLVGLKNLGATCYLNSLIQILFSLRPFRNSIYAWRPSDEPASEEEPLRLTQVMFGHLQYGNQKSYSPVNFVETMKLDKGEQQDAQEFSKLFLSYLEAQLSKQKNPELATRVQEQFNGEYAYVTTCKKCGYASKNPSTYSELQLNINNSSSIEGMMADLLKEEILDGDNQYFCQRCNSKQDAGRRMVLLTSPKILNLQLSRFIFDPKTEQKKKLNKVVAFDSTMDISGFLEGGKSQQELRYTLKAVLVHKGTSAYQGHYVSYIFNDRLGVWFKIDDDVAENLGPQLRFFDPSSTPAKPKGKKKTKGKKEEAEPKSDDEDPAKSSPKKTQPSNPNSFSSKEAYTLVYCLNSTADLEDVPFESLPGYVQEDVQNANAEFEKAIDSKHELEKSVTATFETELARRKSIFSCWIIPDEQTPSYLVSAEWLRKWSGFEFFADKESSSETSVIPPPCPPPPPAEDLPTTSSDVTLTVLEVVIPSLSTSPAPIATPTPSPTPEVAPEDPESVEEKTGKIIPCPHGKLHPESVKFMKRISYAAHEIMSQEDPFYMEYSPKFTTADICRDCFRVEVREHREELAHELMVDKLASLSPLAKGEQKYHWISRHWLRGWTGDDWRASEKAMLNDDLLCCHGALIPDPKKRKQISIAAWKFIKDFAGGFQELNNESYQCEECNTAKGQLAQQQKEIRAMISVQKHEVKRLVTDSTQPPPNKGFVVENDFLDSLGAYLKTADESVRPAFMNNTPLICEHGLLLHDLNDVTELHKGILSPSPFAFCSVTLASPAEWDYIKEVYGGGPDVSYERDAVSGFIKTVPETCEPCARKKKHDFAETRIYVSKVLQDPSDPEGSVEKKPASTSAPVVEMASASTGARRSRRNKNQQLIVLKVTKGDSVATLKYRILEEQDISPSRQRLFLNGKELLDSTTRIDDLDIYPNTVLELLERSEDDDFETVPSSKKYERGFEGTGLISTGGNNGKQTPVYEELPGLSTETVPSPTLRHLATTEESSSSNGGTARPSTSPATGGESPLEEVMNLEKQAAKERRSPMPDPRPAKKMAETKGGEKESDGGEEAKVSKESVGARLTRAGKRKGGDEEEPNESLPPTKSRTRRGGAV